MKKIKNDIKSFLDNNDISNSVYSNSIILVEMITEYLDLNVDCYPTDYGTVCIDIEEYENYIFIEIGKDSFGYFTDGDYNLYTDRIYLDKPDINIDKFKTDIKTIFNKK